MNANKNEVARDGAVEELDINELSEAAGGRLPRPLPLPDPIIVNPDAPLSQI